MLANKLNSNAHLGSQAVDGHRTMPDGMAITKIDKVEIAGDPVRIEERPGGYFKASLGSEVDIECLAPPNTEGESGIVGV